MNVEKYWIDCISRCERRRKYRRANNKKQEVKSIPTIPFSRDINSHLLLSYSANGTTLKILHIFLLQPIVLFSPRYLT